MGYNKIIIYDTLLQNEWQTQVNDYSGFRYISILLNTSHFTNKQNYTGAFFANN